MWSRCLAFVLGIAAASAVPAAGRGVEPGLPLSRDEEAIVAVVRAIAGAADSPKPVCVVVLWSESGAVQPSEHLLQRLEREPGVATRPPCQLRLDVGPVEWTSDSVALVRAGEPSPPCSWL